MPDIIIVVTDEKYAGLQAAAKRDGKTAEKLAQEQMDYYTDVVIKDFVAQPVELTAEEKAAMEARLAAEKGKFLDEVATKTTETTKTT